MVYSSNLEKFKRESGGKLDNLLESDYVIGGWNKREFTFEAALDAMNRHIEKDRAKSVSGRLMNLWDRTVDYVTRTNKQRQSFAQMVEEDN